MKKFWFLTVIFICCISSLSVMVYGISSREKKQIAEFGGSTLQGLEGVRIVFLVADIGGKKRQARSSYYTCPADWNDEFRTEAELVLRRNGIKIFSGEPTTEEIRDHVSASLCVLAVVNAMKTKSEVKSDYLYAFTVSVTVEDFVVTIRDTGALTKAKIWSIGRIESQTPTISGRIPLKQAMKEDILKQVTIFCNDYLAANPKEQPKDEQKQLDVK